MELARRPRWVAAETTKDAWRTALAPSFLLISAIIQLSSRGPSAWTIGFLILVALMLLHALATVMFFHRHPELQRTGPPPTPTRRSVALWLALAGAVFVAGVVLLAIGVVKVGAVVLIVGVALSAPAVVTAFRLVDAGGRR
ncbi:hypothetical protein [Nakamurella leprariae]|uniref:Uncharacterized protein n=1 Tax=Nakamurella leprariae TaxID=2803911 RepID=A0A938YIV2_9ACTN|nr:hypothetical protein [Nakamurella leprariae]MBM9468944.1 hypothetical protein [Nakamurella leprariae]